MPIPRPKYRNSAGRLLAALTAIPTNNSLLESIPPVFGFEPNDQREKQQAANVGLQELHALYVQFIQDMMDAEIGDQQRTVLLNGLQSLRDSIYPIQLNASYRPLSDAEKSLLEVAATVLTQEDEILESELDLIRESIRTLQELVDKASISPALRKVLLDLIRMSQDAISRYNIHGARDLRKAFNGMLADAAEAYGLASGSGSRDEMVNSGAWGKICAHLRVIDNVASRLLKYKPLLEKASQILLRGPPPSE